MAKELVSDELWARVEPLLPKVERRFRYPGRKRMDDRRALTGVLFVLKTGIPWEDLPQEMGCGSGMTCWRRLRDWNAAGVWDTLHEVLLIELNASGQIDWSRGVIDSGIKPRSFWGLFTGPSPVDRAKKGVKHHALTEASGIPLAVSMTGANRNDVTQLLPLVDAVPAVRGRVGRPRRRFDSLLADRGYDHDKYRRELRSRGIRPVIARRGTQNGSGLGEQRYVIERTMAHLHQARRLRTCYEKRADIHEAFLKIRACQLCFKRLEKSFC